MNKLYALLVVLILILLYLHFRIDPNVQNDIQSLAYAKSKTADFVFPQISHGFKQLSKGHIKPLDNLLDILPTNKDDINIIRNSGRDVENRFYVPNYFRKDTLDRNNIGTEEVRPFILDDKKSEQSWTDSNVSNHPKYYTSDFKNNITNSGNFYDKNNQFNDTTSSNTNTLPSDNCYISKNGEVFCKDNTRIQNIPPALINDESLNSLNIIGVYKDKSSFDSITNDKEFYNNVYASKELGTNETYSEPLRTLTTEF